MRSFAGLLCPVCRAQLMQVETVLKCSQRHSFDIAREGYVNLLQTKVTGDTKEMLQARRAFLEAGYYQTLSSTINNLVLRLVEEQTVSATTILDAGCGEGYYLGRLQQALSSLKNPPHSLGLDASKEAIRLAAKRYKEPSFVVADLKTELVLADQSLGLILNIFAPRNVAEFARVLRPKGWLLVVIPGPEHLQELRAVLPLLGIEEDKQQRVRELFADHFELITSTDVKHTLHLDHQALVQLVTMTPNSWHLSPKLKVALDRLESIDTSLSCTCLLFQKR